MGKTINYFFIIYVIIYPALSRLFFNFDGAGRIYMLLAALSFLFNYSENSYRHVLKDKAIVCWTIWCIYVSIDWLVIGIPKDGLSPFVYLFNSIFLPLLVMIVATYECRRDAKEFVLVTLAAFIIYVIIGLLFQDQTSGTVRGGQILGNDLPLTAVSMFAIASIAYVNKWCDTKVFTISLLLSVFAILFVATRKAFFGDVIILFFTAIAIFNIVNAKHVFILIFFLFMLYVIGNYIMDNTLLGTRIKLIENDANKFNTTDIWLLDLVGDRAVFYIRGWKLFLENIWFGIGVSNFPKVANYPFVIHSEYMVQLAETGIIGSTLYIMFNYNVLKRIRVAQVIAEEPKKYFVFYGYMACLLFISLTAWTYTFPRYFLIIGIILGYCHSKMNR